MSRPLRIEFPNAWYHVMNRGRRHENVFHSPVDYHGFIKVLKEAIAEFGLQVSAYCLMPNHYHLLVKTPLGNLSRCMRHINGVYTQRYNKIHDSDGQLFRGRYKAVLIEDDRYLLEVMKYIHKNPVSALLVEKMKDYPWSSFCGYTSNAMKHEWLSKEYLLSMLDSRRTLQKKAYFNFMDEKVSEEVVLFYSMKKLSVVLGSKKFKEHIDDIYGNRIFEREISEAKQLALTKERIVNAICSVFKIDKEFLFNSRRGVTNNPRDICMYLFKIYRFDSLNEIGKYFDVNHYSTVSSAIQRVKKGLQSSKEIRKYIDIIEKDLNKGQQ